MTCASTASTFTLSLNSFFSNIISVLSRNPFLFTTICVAGGGPFRAADPSQTRNSFLIYNLPPLCPLFAAFSPLVSFLFSNLQPLFCTYRGYPHNEIQYSLISAQLSELGVSALSFSGLSTFNRQLSTLFGRIE
jgi:hypothetical protein